MLFQLDSCQGGWGTAARNVVFSLDSNFTLYNFPAAVNSSNYTLRSTAILGMHMHLENGLFSYVSSAIMFNVTYFSRPL